MPEPDTFADASTDPAHEENWPGASVLTVFEEPVAGEMTRRVTLLQPTDLPYPIRIEEFVSANGDILRSTEMVANRFMAKVDKNSIVNLESFAAAHGISLRKIGRDGLYRLQISTLEPDGVPLAIEKILQQADGILYAEPDYILRIALAPNDPEYADGTLWGMNNTGQNGGVADGDIDAPEAWDIRTSAANVIVGVVDTGVNYLHEDLIDNMWVNPGEDGLDSLGRDKRTNGVDDDGNGYIDDVHGINLLKLEDEPELAGDPMDDNRHGSHCAGTIAGRGNNGLGVVGVAWEAQIMGLKFLSKSGSGSNSGAAMAIQYAIDHGAFVSNHSYSGSQFSQTMRDMMRTANAAGHLIVAAAGNATDDNDLISAFPTSYQQENIIAVAAFDRTDRLADFSNFGSGWVDIAAPGEAVYSTTHNDTSSYNSLSGTSMAAPHVVGAAALLKAQFPNETHIGIKNRLLSSVRKNESAYSTILSKGFLNLNNALRTTSSSPYNDDFANAHVVVDEVEQVRANNYFATAEFGEPLHAGVNGNSIWYSYEAYSDGPPNRRRCFRQPPGYDYCRLYRGFRQFPHTGCQHR